MVALWDNLAAIVDLHKEFGVPIDSTTLSGQTALHLAATSGHVSTARWGDLDPCLTLPLRCLLQLGADHTIADMNDSTPWMLAKDHIRHEVLSMMEKEFNVTQ